MGRVMVIACENCRRLEREIEKRDEKIKGLERQLDDAKRAQKRQAAPFSKGSPKEDPKTRGRKKGDAYGRKGNRPPPTEVDEVYDVPHPTICPCGGHVTYDHTTPQYQTEIPRKPIHRRFDVHVGACDCCGRRHQGRHPLQTSDAIGAASAQLGADAQAMTSLLKNEVGVSYGDIESIFDIFFGIRLTRGGAAQIVLRSAERVEAAYHGIEIIVRRSRICYPDETGWKVEGLLQWMWVFVTRSVTLFRIRPSRGFDVAEDVLGAKWSGTLGHDGWSVYDRFLNALHQQCLGHILARCDRILDNAIGGAVRFPRAVSELLHDAFDLRDRRDAGEISPHGVAVATGRLDSRLDELLNGNLINPTNIRLANHLDNHQDELFTFLRQPGVEATSWPADQAIRPAVVNRKVFGGNRDPAGARAQEILSSIFATCIKRGVAAFDYVSQVLRAPPDERDELACELLGLPQPG
jgi:transposase